MYAYSAVCLNFVLYFILSFSLSLTLSLSLSLLSLLDVCFIFSLDFSQFSSFFYQCICMFIVYFLSNLPRRQFVTVI